jgi:hypothetical protein
MALSSQQAEDAILTACLQGWFISNGEHYDLAMVNPLGNALRVSK